MVPEYELLLEWLVANGQNRLEWVILDSPDWAPGFVSSALRQGRLRQLTDLARLSVPGLLMRWVNFHTANTESGAGAETGMRAMARARSRRVL